MPPNGGAHLPAPGLQNHDTEQDHGRMQKAPIQRSAEGAGQVQRVLGRSLLTEFNVVGSLTTRIKPQKPVVVVILVALPVRRQTIHGIFFPPSKLID